MIKGIDISSWQGVVDFNKVKTSYDFVIMKATEGVGFIDPKFKENQIKARESGILVGYYAFVRPDLGNLPDTEAEYFIKVTAPKEGEVLALDFEVTYGNKVIWCKKWLDRVYQLTGCRPLIYLNKSLISGNDWSSIISANYGLWMADYSYNPDSEVPDNPWPIVAMRQYSNHETVPGIVGGVDANVFYGDKTTFKKYGLPQQAEPSVPSTPCDDVTADLKVCEANLKTMTGLLETEMTTRKSLEAVVKDQNELIATLRLELTKNKPLSDYTVKELIGALFKKV